jgi:hypothetical protein
MEESSVMHRYLCPAAGRSSIFHTVKYLCDHIGLFHDTPKHASPLICGINTCKFKSMSVGAIVSTFSDVMRRIGTVTVTGE